MPGYSHASNPHTQSSRLHTKPRSALIVYGSETGNAHDVAEELGRLAQQYRFTTLVLDFDSIQLRDLLKFSLVIFVVSTAGQGEFPQNARTLWKALLSGALKPGVFRRLHFTSFGLGDSSYPRYNVAHRMLHGRLLQLGAQTFCERGEGNEQHPEGHSAGLREWLLKLKASLLSTFSLPEGVQPLPEDAFIEPHFKLCKLDSSIEDVLIRSLSLRKEINADSRPSAALLPVKNGYVADIIMNQRVTPEDHFQDVRLFDFCLDRHYEYGPGAVAVVYPKNFPEDVQQFIELMGWSDIADAPLKLQSTLEKTTALKSPSPLRHFDLAGIQLTMRWLLENALDFMAIPRRSFFATLVHFAGSDNEDQTYQKDRLIELANPELIDELWDYTTRPKRTILEVMMDFTTIKIPWQYALSTLPIMRGRQFSIASGGALTTDENGRTRVQLLVAIVDPPSPIIKWRRRYGICTRYMTQLQAKQQICIQMQPGYLDVKPHEIETPILMIGPGTGVAPMRSMIYARSQWSKESAKKLSGDVLFFGCRSATADNFFADEWKSISEDKLRVMTAFSRDDRRPRQYVQDQIRANATLVASTLLERQGKVYVCGSSGNMPKGVREALAEALATHDSIADQDAAGQYLDDMEKAGRYKQETW